MMGQREIIIETLVIKVSKGIIKFEDLPEGYKEEVHAELEKRGEIK